MTRTSKKLKIALIAIVIYAIIATVIIVCLTTRKEKDTATPTAAAAEAQKIGVSETDDYRKLPKEKQSDYLALRAAKYVDTLDDYYAYADGRDRAKDALDNLQVITNAATDEMKLEDLNFDGVSNYDFGGKTFVTVWTTDDDQKNVNAVIKNGNDEKEWVFIEICPDHGNVVDGRTAAKLYVHSGELYKDQRDILVDKSFFGETNQDKLEKKVAYLCLR